MAKTKTVCIVGAGPSGLTAAKALLHDAPTGSFDVTVFERQPRIGGLWPLHRHGHADDGAGLLHPNMVTNQSRHTVQFSDLAWEPDAPQMPRAWQVGRYLERYRDAYCRAASIRLGEAVERAESVDGAWVVETRATGGSGQVVSHVFDYLLVASGFFGKPLVPPALKDLSQTAGVPVLHSSQFRDVKQLLAETAGTGGKILVAGGQMSGVEMAGTIASQLACEVNAPGRSEGECEIPHVDQYTVHHLVQRPTYIFPLFTSPDNHRPDPPFLPLDLPSWDLVKRETPLTNLHGVMPAETARVLHDVYEASACSNSSPALAVRSAERDSPAYLAVSNSYAEFVRSGLVTVSRGRLASVSGRVAAVSDSDDQETRIHDVAAVLLATGFAAAPSVSYLPSSVNEKLMASSVDRNSTFALAFHGTHHPSVPNLGFVGFYRSPFWGVMELQARFVTELWLAGGPASPSLTPAMAAALENDTSMERVMAIRHAGEGAGGVSQFPMGDYPWLMHELATALGLERAPHLSAMPVVAGKRMDILTPARYPPKIMDHSQRAEWRTSLQQIEDTVRQAVGGKFVAAAVFRSLQGTWAMERDIQSKRADMPSGTFTGTAEFRRRAGTADGREAAFDPEDAGAEYLYVEAGDFTTTTGHVFPTTRRYVYRYDEPADALSAWFVRTDDRERVDYMFHQVPFDAPDEGKTGWTAGSEHLCVEDKYVVKYEFVFKGVDLADWKLQYQVEGPKKDYCMWTRYARPAASRASEASCPRNIRVHRP